MKLYHGTSVENAKSIKRGGLKASNGIINEGHEIFVMGMTMEKKPIRLPLPWALRGKEHLVPKFIYLSEDIELARGYGEVVFCVDTDDLDEKKLGTYKEGIGLIYNYESDIPAKFLKKV